MTSLSAGCSKRGLSPRVRGNPTAQRFVHHLRGSIPACAGEPGSIVAQCAWSEVYPRVCGGTSYPRENRNPVYGLSPRVRGNRQRVGPPDRRPRSIPACAGEPRIRVPSRPSPPVYPRVCGGTPSPPVANENPKGLSPRVRGNPPMVFIVNTPSWVYPRVCGGTMMRCWLITPNAGLSPRVRGNPR